MRCFSRRSRNDVVKCDDNTDGGVPKRKGRGKDRQQRRQKGTGGLQLEKTSMYTVRCIINGRRIAKSTGTKDKEEAERFLKRFLAPYVKGDAERTFVKIKEAVATEEQLAEMREDERPQLKLDEVWEAYDKSLMRRDLAQTTLDGKQQVWRLFREYMRKVFPEVTELRHVRRDHAEAYLQLIRDGHSALTYNQRLCVLREMTRVLMDEARCKVNPWEGFKLRPDDSHTRRELTVEELARLIDMASREGFEWRCLFAIGMYTGMRLGDCCKLTWSEVDIVRSVIQRIPDKTKKYRKGRPITVSIHKVLSQLLMQTLQRIYDWAYPLVSRWQPMAGVPLWLYNELKHVEEGGGEGRSPGGIRNESPLLADLTYHGVLGDGPWWDGNKVLPSTFVFGKAGMKNEK